MMKKRQIVNIINFIRGCEPREEVDLVRPVREQIALLRENGLRGTFLIQYDALMDPVYTDMLKELDPAQFEIGVWFEVVQPLVEKCGIPWRGRFPWDWHVHCGFSMGYPKEQRARLLDELYRAFRDIFGYYPRVFGSWFFDSFTARYVSDTYGADAFCNCKEQYGTDGYTLWGGHYGQGYYPSRKNVFMPAQTLEQQLPVPLFRMLGSDPVYQYDFGMTAEGGADEIQRVITLEPVYPNAGCNPKWVDWYLGENFNGECLSFGYTQAGQENSFGWPAMEQGLRYQFARFAQLQKEGKLTVETLGETGRWYQKTYALTPASTISAHSACDDECKNSIWYCSRYYRVNLYRDQLGLRIRDLHLFRETWEDPFETEVCTRNEAVFESLPVMDGNLMTGKGTVAGWYLRTGEGDPITAEGFRFTQLDDSTALVDFGGIRFHLRENGIRIQGDRAFRLEWRQGRFDRHTPERSYPTEKEMALSYQGVDYALKLDCGIFQNGNICAVNGDVEISFLQK